MLNNARCTIIHLGSLIWNICNDLPQPLIWPRHLVSNFKVDALLSSTCCWGCKPRSHLSISNFTHAVLSSFEHYLFSSSIMQPRSNLLPNSLSVSHLISIFSLLLIKKWLGSDRKGRSCYGNQAGNKSWTHGDSGRGRLGREKEGNVSE